MSFFENVDTQKLRKNSRVSGDIAWARILVMEGRISKETNFHKVKKGPIKVRWFDVVEMLKFSIFIPSTGRNFKILLDSILPVTPMDSLKLFNFVR